MMRRMQNLEDLEKEREAARKISKGMKLSEKAVINDNTSVTEKFVIDKKKSVDGKKVTDGKKKKVGECIAINEVAEKDVEIQIKNVVAASDYSNLAHDLCVPRARDKRHVIPVGVEDRSVRPRSGSAECRQGSRAVVTDATVGAHVSDPSRRASSFEPRAPEMKVRDRLIFSSNSVWNEHVAVSVSKVLLFPCDMRKHEEQQDRSLFRSSISSSEQVIQKLHIMYDRLQAKSSEVLRSKNSFDQAMTRCNQLMNESSTAIVNFERELSSTKNELSVAWAAYERTNASMDDLHVKLTSIAGESSRLRCKMEGLKAKQVEEVKIAEENAVVAAEKQGLVQLGALRAKSFKLGWDEALTEAKVPKSSSLWSKHTYEESSAAPISLHLNSTPTTPVRESADEDDNLTLKELVKSKSEVGMESAGPGKEDPIRLDDDTVGGNAA